jgi:hypothetical protein
MTRRRPVPRGFRDDEHTPTSRSHAWGSGFRRVSRTSGSCRCGARFPRGQNVDNLDAAGFREAWLDHVEGCYYAQPGATVAVRVKAKSGVAGSVPYRVAVRIGQGSDVVLSCKIEDADGRYAGLGYPAACRVTPADIDALVSPAAA